MSCFYFIFLIRIYDHRYQYIILSQNHQKFQFNKAATYHSMTDARTNNHQLPQPHEKVEEESIVLHSRKSVDDVWKEIVNTCKQEPPDPHEMMTLEDFLAKAQEDDVKIPLPTLPLPLPSERLLSGGGGIFSSDVVGVGGGCGKRRAILEPLDKAAQQRQRRMIKNRESAARSRERKQAYQAELESLALRLEEEHETLLKAKTEQTRKRYNQLMENIIPVTEKQRSTRYVLRKVRSMEWQKKKHKS